MKKLGILGGMGPESTLDYYKDIVFAYQSRIGKKEFPNLTVESIDIYSMLQLCEQKRYGI